MGDKPLGVQDYPLAETCPERVTGHRGKPLDALTIEAVLSGELQMEDLRITAEALRQQAEISKAAGRAALGRNFERAAEMTKVPQAEVMEVYELLRPGRAASKEALLQAAQGLRETYGAEELAALVEEAAEVYEKRGLFRTRY
ncbi:glycerol dehydratase [Roseovarius sp. HI0049]|nr:glycerol dehydratase [Roseovarius sp. HI0049]